MTAVFGRFLFQNFGTTTPWKLSKEEKQEEEKEESEDQEFTYQNPIPKNPEFETPNDQTPRNPNQENPKNNTPNIQNPLNQNNLNSKVINQHLPPVIIIDQPPVEPIGQPIQPQNQQNQQLPPQQQMAYAPITKLNNFNSKEDDAQVWLNDIAKAITANNWDNARAIQVISYFLQDTTDACQRRASATTVVNKSTSEPTAILIAIHNQEINIKIPITTQPQVIYQPQPPAIYQTPTIQTPPANPAQITSENPRLRITQNWRSAIVVHQPIPSSSHQPSDMPLFSEAALEEKPIMAMYTDTKIITADGATKTPIGEIDDFPIEVNNIIVLIKVLMMEATQYQALVDNDWLSKINAVFNWMTQKLDNTPCLACGETLLDEGMWNDILGQGEIMTLAKIQEASPEEIKEVKNNLPELLELNWDKEPVINLLEPEKFYEHYQTLAPTKEEQEQHLYSDNNKSIIPECAHDIDAGFDLRYPKKDAIKLKPHSHTCIDLKVALEIPTTTIVQLASRSRLVKKGINIRGGIIDMGYVENIIAILQNDSEKAYIIEPNEKIAQAIFLPLVKIAQLVSVRNRKELGITAKEIQGFGSMGRIDIPVNMTKEKIIGQGEIISTDQAILIPPYDQYMLAIERKVKDQAQIFEAETSFCKTEEVELINLHIPAKNHNHIKILIYNNTENVVEILKETTLGYLTTEIED
ncbi:hypothetical protein G9A89_003309 [Geosiphon pyriformis]|nr:hypothetical protein G9A89_003309 [Geosiphon pyriformis]